MPIRDILLHVGASRAYGGRLRVTLLLARLFEARVIGISVLPDPDVTALAKNGATAAELAAELARLEDEATHLGNNLMTALGRHRLSGEWRMVRGPAAAAIARQAHAVDLIVLSQHDPEHPGDLAAPEDVVLTSGRPVLIVPYTGRFHHVGKKIVVGWNGSREATRAAQAALPIMATSSVVTVLRARPPTDGRSEDRSAELMHHLQRHDLRARREIVAAAQEDVAEALQLRAVSLGADLIVMGAFGRSRLREAILGGTTSDMLEQMIMPVLMTY